MTGFEPAMYLTYESHNLTASTTSLHTPYNFVPSKESNLHTLYTNSTFISSLLST